MSATAQAIPGTKARARPRSSLRQLRDLSPYLRRYWARLALGVGTLLMMGLVGVLAPLAIGAIIDSLSGSRAILERATVLPTALRVFLQEFYRPFSRETLLFYGATLLGIIAVKGVLSFLTRSILINVSRDIEYDMRNDLMEKLAHLEPAFYVRNRTGELMSRCTNDLTNVRMVLGPGIMYSGTTIVTFIAAIFVMMKLSAVLTLWVLLPVPAVAASVRLFGKVIHERYEKIQALLAGLSAKVQENLAGVRVIRAYVQEEAEKKAFEAQNKEYIGKNLELIRTWSLFYPALEVLIGITFLIVLWQGGKLVLLGTLSIGTLMAFYAYMGQLIWPMIALGWVTNIFQRGAASMGRLNYILTTMPVIDDARARADGDEIRGEIEFRNLTFAYPMPRPEGAGTNGSGVAGRALHQTEQGAAQVLRNINLRVPAGTTLAIVGPTGSGKSTLVSLIARLYDAAPGMVRVDGRPIQEWPLDVLRRSIGYVPQDTFLFSETVKENIALGVDAAELEEIERAARIASLTSDIEDFPKQFETMVGERGITLSGGQKQRTALARALVRDPKILILDDALSSVDTHTEEQILRGLADVIRQRTTILISHRVSTVQYADQIVVLKDGEIVERGTHEELLATGGYYADLYQKQLLEEELEEA